MAKVSNLSQQTLRRLENLVCQIIGKALGLEDVEFDKLFIDYCDDTLDLVFIVMALEEHFAIAIDNQKVAKFTNAADITKHLVNTLSEEQLLAGIEKEI